MHCRFPARIQFLRGRQFISPTLLLWASFLRYLELNSSFTMTPISLFTLFLHYTIYILEMSIVHLVETTYEKGVKVLPDKLKHYQSQWQPSPTLSQWDITIVPT
jgi:hypothetical protein